MNAKEFWSGKNVLVTGGNGFVASNLILKLYKLGANIYATVRENAEKKYDAIKMLSKYGIEYTKIPTEMYDYSEVGKELCTYKIDTIFHLAASAVVAKAAVQPLPTLYNNIIPTINILEAARINKVPRILVASTDKVYGDHTDARDNERLPYREEYALRGLDVYSASKASVDLICQAIAMQYRLPVLVTRCPNIYGPGDVNFTRLIPRTIMRILSGEPPVIHEENNDVLREYMYIDDVVNAYIFLAEHTEEYYKKYPQSGNEAYGWPCFNVGSYNSDTDSRIWIRNPQQLSNIKDTKTIISLINDILKRAHEVEPIEPEIIHKGNNFVEISNQYLDSKKFLDFGFKPEVNLDTGLEKTIQWYHDHFDFLKNEFGEFYLA